MGTTQEIIQIITENIVKGQEQLVKLQKSYLNQQKIIKENNQVISEQTQLAQSGIAGSKEVAKALKAENAEIRDIIRPTKDKIDTISKEISMSKTKLSVAKESQQSSAKESIQMQTLRQLSAKYGATVQNLKKGMSNSNIEIDKEGQLRDIATGNLVEQDSTMKKVIRTTKRFQFEWLSVMFLSMAINKVFAQYTQGAMEWIGATELFTESLKLSVFTALEPFLDSIIQASTAIFDMPEGVQKLIGWFIILMTAITGLALWLAILKLGFNGINMLNFSGLIGWFSSIGQAITGVSIGVGALIAIIAIIAIILIGMFVAWKENFMGMKLVVTQFVAGVKTIFKGLFDYFGGIIDFFVAIFKGDWEGMIEAVKRIIFGFQTAVVGVFIAIVRFAEMIFIGIVRVVKFVIDRVVGFFQWLYEKLVGGSIIPDLINAIIRFFATLPGRIFEILRSMLAGIFQWGIDLVTNIANGIASTGRKVIDAILNLFPSWMRNAIETSGKIVINIIHNVTEVVSKVFKKQSGGPVGAGNPYLVGEAGPELFVPSNSGKIIPNKALGGESPIIFSPIYNIAIADKREFETMIKQNNVRMVEDLRRLINT